jgi:hypothetical protein
VLERVSLQRGRSAILLFEAVSVLGSGLFYSVIGIKNVVTRQVDSALAGLLLHILVCDGYMSVIGNLQNDKEPRGGCLRRSCRLGLIIPNDNHYCSDSSFG